MKTTDLGRATTTLQHVYTGIRFQVAVVASVCTNHYAIQAPRYIRKCIRLGYDLQSKTLFLAVVNFSKSVDVYLSVKDESHTCTREAMNLTILFKDF